MDHSKHPTTFNFMERYTTQLRVALGIDDLFSANDRLHKKSDATVASMKVGNDLYYLFYRPEHAKYILHDNPQNFPKISDAYCPTAFRIMSIIMGNGLITSDGHSWKKQKKRVSPHFLGKIIGAYDDALQYTLSNTLNELHSKMESCESFNIEPVLRTIALTMITLIIFGKDLNRESEQMRNVVDICLHDFNRRSSSIALPPRVPTPWNLKLRSAIKYISQVIFQDYQERLDSKDYRTDLLGMLMSATDEDTGKPLPFEQIRDEIITIILAGHETTASALSWIIYLLTTHPEWEQRLLDEWQFEGDIPTYSMVDKFIYTKMVVKEALRLYPTVWNIVRTCKDGDTIDGFEIKKNTNINIVSYFIHRHPDFWDNPDKFDPGRFHPSKLSSIHEYAYLPFSYGAHACLGRQLAMFEMMVVIPAIFKMFKVMLAPSARIVKECIISIRPKHGVDVILEPRSTARKEISHVKQIQSGQNSMLTGREQRTGAIERIN